MPDGTNPMSVLKPDRPVGIVGYGAYVPRYRLPGREVARVWTGGLGGSPVKEKAVAGLDEDVITMSIEAAQNALARAGIDPRLIRAVWVGSESHPYAVKPTSTVVAESIGAAPNVQAADLEFACKAGSEAMQAGIGFAGSGMGGYVLAIGLDTAQARPGDALEHTAAARGAAFISGPAAAAGALPVRSGSARNPGYLPLTPQSLAEFDRLAILPSPGYPRGPTPPRGAGGRSARISTRAGSPASSNRTGTGA